MPATSFHERIISILFDNKMERIKEKLIAQAYVHVHISNYD
jgi:hypothetical protein